MKAVDTIQLSIAKADTWLARLELGKAYVKAEAYAEAYAEFERNRERLVNARKEIATCAISGAVGTFANIDPFVEEYVCEKLNLKPANIATQIIQRDHHCQWLTTIALIGSSLNKVATEIRLLQKTEVLEV